ncbi:sialate O-acetylesterase [Coraliomargarita algicola]|uniref:Sialate O-acetylesterase n=1 Tax=Coraliomargarita algicola TaxID=3092156 RepID=A0ABZ0RPA3_9BACT|nr:sialate O-acetylesterase [Coraliomargarita sp. J2-16]WPJ96727.1 sialate O-acetylesterase [Coraliomargarita sp. J2-16]
MKCKLFTIALASCALAAGSWAEVRMPAIFSDHMVLQRAAAVPIWGWADAGEEVRVQIGERVEQTTANQQGKWALDLDLSSLDHGPHTVEVSGQNTVTIEDVLLGEVWLCSGQSNMELRLFYSLNVDAEKALPSNEMLREFKVKKQASANPMEDVEGQWLVASPKTIENFGGVAYYFGKSVQHRLGVPVGLIRSAWGGSMVESWTRSEALDTDPDLKQGKETAWQRFDGYPAAEKAFFADYLAWQQAYGRADRAANERPAWVDSELDTSDWSTITLPGMLQPQGMPANGAVWFRKTVELDEGPSADGWAEVKLGRVGDFHQVYWDGELKAETKPGEDMPFQQASFWLRKQSEIAPGKHSLVVRMFSHADRGGVVAKPSEMSMGPRKLLLSGEWDAKVEFELAPVAGEARAALPKAPSKPPSVHYVASRLYNGMIAPLVPYAMRGAIWYQGESNAGRAMQYQKTFPLMIEDWRSQWGMGDFPFYFCQLANYQHSKDQPGESSWAEFREAQAKALELPNTGQAVLIDTGLAEDIHPLNRKDQGERLARAALAKTYKQDIAYSGPVYQGIEIEHDRIRVLFDGMAGGLVAKPLPEEVDVRYFERFTKAKTIPVVLPLPESEVQGFAICGKDQKWHWAHARIEGDTVVVWSPQVTDPVAVRYAWAENPVCNLYDDAGLPASPFRSDDFRGVSDGRYYMEDYAN